jgi:hypothetical protein
MRTPTTFWFGCVGLVITVRFSSLVVNSLSVCSQHQAKGRIRLQMSEDNSKSEKVVLVVGSCGMDRLLSVQTYPSPDAKVRTTSYHEIGGGNAANTAYAMAFLSHAAFLGDQNFRFKLLGKIGDDYIGKQLKDELELTCLLHYFALGMRGPRPVLLRS